MRSDKCAAAIDCRPRHQRLARFSLLLEPCYLLLFSSITGFRSLPIPSISITTSSPYFKFRDHDGLRRDAVAGKKHGFKGKFAIHPAQIEPINEIFSPSPAEIAYARRVVVAFEGAEAHGRGSTSLDGSVIDVPVVKRARALLEMAEKLNASDK